ncbi:MAG TPA: hypothetical protein VK789_28230 [Bryobacteraceae bacterium]|jgi:hypothetical protein|nr:hypothetical protein [Bryobacteraceae bacterium]
MKLLINIDQRASLAAGYEAPTSTAIVDIPIKAFPDTMRAAIASNYDPRTKRLIFPFGDEAGGKEVTLPHPISDVKVLAEIKRLYTEWLGSVHAPVEPPIRRGAR